MSPGRPQRVKYQDLMAVLWLMDPLLTMPPEACRWALKDMLDKWHLDKVIIHLNLKPVDRPSLRSRSRQCIKHGDVSKKWSLEAFFTQRPHHTSPKGISYSSTKDILNLSEGMLCLPIHALDCNVGLCLMILNPISVLHEQLIWVL